MTSAAAAPVPLAARALAPDVARGAMLLLIALANAHFWLYGGTPGTRAYPRDLAGADQVVALLQVLLVDGRAYPLFGLLFGYGVVQLAARRAGAPPDALVRLVRRRGRWMIAIGLVHGALLWPGDIVGAYGLLAVLLAGVLVRGAPGSLAGLAVAGVVTSSLFGTFSALPPPPGMTAFLPSIGIADPALAALFRVVEWVAVGVLGQSIAVFGAVALGAWAGRRRILDEPDRHLPLLRRLAGAGLAAAVLGGLPLALAAAGFWAAPAPALVVAGALHTAGGFAGGVGYAALFGLLAAQVVARPGPAVRALQACGQRSLSCYLAQSVAFGALLPAWSLGWGARLGVAQAALLAVAVWLVVLAVAAASARAGLRGPAEVLLRRLTYGRATARRGDAPSPPAPR